MRTSMEDNDVAMNIRHIFPGRAASSGLRSRLPARTAALLLVLFSIGVATAQQQSLDLQVIGQMLLAKQYAQAVVALQSELATHPDSAEAHAMLAYALFRQDKPADSLHQYTLAAQLRTPTSADLKWVALDYVLLNDYTDADKWMAQSVARDPSDEDAWYALGRIRYTENHFQQAKLCFERALSLVPHDVRAENNLGLTYEALYQLKDAAAAYRQAVAWQQGSAYPSEQPLLNLGILLTNEGHLGQAVPLLKHAASIAPRNPKVHKELARAEYLQGNFPAAAADLETALAASPNDASLHFQMGRVLQKQGFRAQAQAEFARAAAIDGTHASPDR